MKGQIIVMDDDKEYCEVMGEILHQLNYHGICVKDGNEVLQVFKESKQSGKKN